MPSSSIEQQNGVCTFGDVARYLILILFVAIASRLFQTLAARVAGKSEAKPL